MSRAALLVSLYLASMLSGCVSSEAGNPVAGPGADAPIHAQPAAFDDDTGAIEGIVHDDNIAPLAGATVGLLGTDIPPTLTAADGGFSFSHVPPGTYKLVAQMLGYESSAKSITVETGQSTKADLTLIALAIVEPYHEILTAAGLLGCSLSWRPAPPPPAPGYTGLSACGVVASDFDKFLLRLTLTGKPSEWQGTVYELHWKTTQAMGKGLAVPFETDGCWNVGKSRFARMAGYSPLRVWHSPETHAEKFQNNTESPCNTKNNCNEKKCTMGVRVFSNPDTLGPSSAADVGVTVQQSFRAYMSVFYNDAAPETWTAVADT